MSLIQERDALLQRAKAVVDAAKAAARDLTAEESKAVDADLDSVDELNTRIEKAKQDDARLKRLGALGTDKHTDPEGTGEPKAAATLGEHFAKSIAERVKEHRHGERFSWGAPEFKADPAVMVTGGPTGPWGPALTDVDLNIVTGVRRTLTVASLLASETISGSAITYFVEGEQVGGTGTVAEAGLKPQVSFGDPTPHTEALSKIAGHLIESEELAEDLPFLASAINNRLLYDLSINEEDQLLAGAGTGGDILGLLNRNGIQTMAGGNVDSIFSATTLILQNAGLTADGLIINPTDYETIRLSKDANGQYYGGGFFQGQYGAGGILQNPPIWGLRTVVTPAIPTGTVLVGAFAQSASVIRKGGVQVAATNTNEDDFVHNRITIRAEERLALAVRRPAGLVKVTLSGEEPEEP